MAVNIGFNPFDIANMARADSDARTSQSNYLYDRTADRQERNRNYYESVRVYNQQRNDKHNQLQYLKKDAAKAGISMMAALGNTGNTPISLSIPGGQGGRASGRYQRQSHIEGNISVTSELEKAQIANVKADTRTKDAVATNQELRTVAELNPVQPVNVEGSLNQNISATTQRYRASDGSTHRGPSQDFPDIDQAVMWWLQDKYFQLKQKETNPYHPELSRNHRVKEKRLTKRGYRSY